MFGSSVMDDLCLILFPVAYIYVIYPPNDLSRQNVVRTVAEQPSRGVQSRVIATTPLSSRREAFMI